MLPPWLTPLTTGPRIPSAPQAGLVVALTLCAGALSALSAETAPDPVTVGDFTLAPAGDLHDDEHRFEFHPKALLGVGYDSDAVPPPTGNGHGDEFAHSIAGMIMRYHPHPGLDGDLDGELSRLVYSDHPVLDTTGGLVHADINRVAPEQTWHADAGWTRSQESLLTTGEHVDQDLYQTSAHATHDSPDWFVVGDLAAAYLNYRDGTTEFNSKQGDHATYDLGGRVGAISGDDRRFACLRYEYVRYSVTGRFNDANGVTATVGASRQLSPRTELHIEAGGELRRYADNYLHDTANHDKIAIAPWLDAGGTWSWRDGDRVSAKLYSILGDSITSNASWSYGAQANAHADLGRRAGVEAALDVGENRDGGINHSGSTVQRDVIQASASGLYALAAGLATRLRVTDVQVQAPESDTYHRVVISVDLAYAY